jgi:hypothetical protein
MIICMRVFTRRLRRQARFTRARFTFAAAPVGVTRFQCRELVPELVLLQILLQLLQRLLFLFSLFAHFVLKNPATFHEGSLPPLPLLALALPPAFLLFPSFPFPAQLLALSGKFCVQRVPTMLLPQGTLHVRRVLDSTPQFLPLCFLELPQQLSFPRLEACTL